MTDQSDKNLIARIEDDPIAKSLPTRATFIPLRHFDLKRVLIETLEMNPTQSSAFLSLASHVESLFHVEHQSSLRRLEEAYEWLDPDTQLVEVDDEEHPVRDDLGDYVIDCVADRLYSAHYKRLSREELERAIDVGWEWGVKLDVDFELFERLEIFARGYQTVTVSRRRWQRFFRSESIELPEFTRLVMAFRIRKPPENTKHQKTVLQMLDPRFVYLKTFKNIPESEVEILLPGSKVRLTKFDRAKILFPTVSGMAITGYKLARSALLLSLAFSWQTWFGFAVLLGGAVGYVVKSVLSYFRTKSNYQYGLTKNLYLKNLDNNLSVLYRIINESEEQEVSEVILGYAFLWQHSRNNGRGLAAKELDETIEAFILQTTDCEVDFEIHDAIGKLARIGLANVNEDGRWRSVPLEEAESVMKRNWSELYETVGSRQLFDPDVFCDTDGPPEPNNDPISPTDAS